MIAARPAVCLRVKINPDRLPVTRIYSLPGCLFHPPFIFHCLSLRADIQIAIATLLTIALEQMFVKTYPKIFLSAFPLAAVY